MNTRSDAAGLGLEADDPATAAEVEAELSTTVAQPVEVLQPPRRRWGIYLARVVVLVVALILWEIAGNRDWIDQGLFGRPSGIWDAMWDYLPSDRGISSMKATGQAVLYAFVIGSILGTLGGLILGIIPTLDDVIGPFLTPLNSVPRLALAPLFLVWFGLTTSAKVALAVTIVFFILAENARSAVKSVDVDLMTMARVTGLKRPALVAKVVLPSAVPTMFAGLRLTFTYSLLGVVASEMIAAPEGLGQDLVFFSSSYQINHMFAILVLFMFVATIVNFVFAALERYLLRWQRT
ncbi:MAG: ABC transporter permease [Acidimicrobiia bacterium]